MVKRINITIPDELHEEMQKHKFNVSKVCADAIREHIAEINRDKLRLRELDQLLRRMKK